MENGDTPTMNDVMAKLQELVGSPVWQLLEQIETEQRERDEWFAQYTRRRSAKAFGTMPLTTWEDQLARVCYIVCRSAMTKQRTLRLLGIEEAR